MGMNTENNQDKTFKQQSCAQIGSHYSDKPRWQKTIALPFIYIPILIAVPVLIITVFLVRLHLTITGAQNLKVYSDFLPEWLSHRYTYATQITEAKYRWTRAIAKVFWVFNCKLYCPLSVGLIKYLAYLVQIVEMWWCPFNHGKKSTYGESAIDQSFWHIYPNMRKLLNKEDRENPMWNNEVNTRANKS